MNMRSAGSAVKRAGRFISEKGLDADAAIHKKIYPKGCPDGKCWIHGKSPRPTGFDSSPAHSGMHPNVGNKIRR